MKQQVDQDIIDQLPLDRIDRVIFYNRDELATDLICCDVAIGGQDWFFHEELPGWDLLLKHLEQLPGFRTDWYVAVVDPPFARSETLAFERT